jgi:hypothetical protein
MERDNEHSLQFVIALFLSKHFNGKTLEGVQAMLQMNAAEVGTRNCAFFSF